MHNHLIDIEGMNNDQLIEKIYDISDKIVKAQKSGYLLLQRVHLTILNLKKIYI